MEKITHLFISFVVLSVLFAIIETLFAANAYKRPRKGFGTDVIYWAFTPLVSKLITSAGLVALLALAFHQAPRELAAYLEMRDTWATRLPIWLQAFLALVAGDIVAYWMHRLFHGRHLWKFHAVHHCSEELDWLSAVRLHPVNDALTRWVQALIVLALGFNFKVVAGYVPFLTFYAILVHANVTWDFGWLGQLIASPRFHRWHHTSQEEGLDKNFAGLFPWIDRIFGTYYMPKGRVPEKFGLYNEQIPAHIWGQLKYPFIRAKKP